MTQSRSLIHFAIVWHCGGTNQNRVLNHCLRRHQLLRFNGSNRPIFSEWEIRNFVSFSLFLAASRAEGGGKINETTNIEFIRTFLQLWGRPFYWEWPAGEIWVVMFRHYSRFEREMEEEERRELIIWRPASCIRRRSMSALVSVIRLGRANQKPGEFSFFLALLSLIWLLFPFMHFPLVLIAFFFSFLCCCCCLCWMRMDSEFFSPMCVFVCLCVCLKSYRGWTLFMGSSISWTMTITKKKYKKKFKKWMCLYLCAYEIAWSNAGGISCMNIFRVIGRQRHLAMILSTAYRFRRVLTQLWTIWFTEFKCFVFSCFILIETDLWLKKIFELISEMDEILEIHFLAVFVIENKTQSDNVKFILVLIYFIISECIRF